MNWILSVANAQSGWQTGWKLESEPGELTDADRWPTCWADVAGKHRVTGLVGGAKTFWGNEGGLEADDEDTRRIVRMAGKTSKLHAANNNPKTVEEITAGLDTVGLLTETTGTLVDVVGGKLDCSVTFCWNLQWIILKLTLGKALSEWGQTHFVFT